MVALKAWLTEMLKKSDGFSLSIRLTDGSQHACFLFEVLEDALVVVPLGSQTRDLTYIPVAHIIACTVEE